MDEDDLLARRFEAHRGYLRRVAYRMLGSVTEADDAVQESWVRFSRSDVDEVKNLEAWLTTIVARVCLDMLRSRRSRREQPMGRHLPEPVLRREEDADPEQQALLADSVGLALLVVLDTLGPAERLAFVLHDMFAVPFEEIAPIVGRSAAATRQLASRARRRVHGAAPGQNVDPARQRRVVEAFLAAARAGDFAALIAALDPDAVLQVDLGAAGGGLKIYRGANSVAEQARAFAWRAEYAQIAPVDGAWGIVVAAGDRVMAVMSFAVADEKIVKIDLLADPERLRS